MVMPTALDVAQYILERRGPLTTMKLQKLVFYSQVWSIVWDDDRLFPEPIQAWKNGPVVPALWTATAKRFRVSDVPGGTAGELNRGQSETVNLVLDFYGDKDAQWLSDLTHMEDPWKEAYSQGQNTEISLESISEYYSTISADAPA